MKQFLVLVFSILLVGCSDDDRINNCNLLLNVGVNISINLDLPQYSQLQFISNSVYIPNQGNGGVIVTNVGTGLRAWDASDPNVQPSQCSVLQIDGSEAVSSCTEANRYSLFTGQPLGATDLQCGLKEYRVSESGTNSYLITNN
ncbi:hypothetical protein [Paucihalobacter sp.]|uniref:hypothetical protein n=1 Tax=Paucihalobacter sp. TaxID=2850405 RepID=UPI002FE2CFB5